MTSKPVFVSIVIVFPALFIAGCAGEEAEEDSSSTTSWNLLDIVPVEAAEPPLMAHARPIVWEIEPLGAHGGMSVYMLDGVEYLLDIHSDELDSTYRRYLNDDPMLCGEVTAHITTESGVFLFCSLEENTTGNEELGTALFTQMQNWNWPSSGRDVFRIHLHLRRNLGTGRGFVDAGSQQLKPDPLPPPPVIEEERTGEQGDESVPGAAEINDAAGVGASPEGYDEERDNGE